MEDPRAWEDVIGGKNGVSIHGDVVCGMVSVNNSLLNDTLRYGIVDISRQGGVVGWRQGNDETPLYSRFPRYLTSTLSCEKASRMSIEGNKATNAALRYLLYPALVRVISI